MIYNSSVYITDFLPRGDRPDWQAPKSPVPEKPFYLRKPSSGPRGDIHSRRIRLARTSERGTSWREWKIPASLGL